MSSIHNNQNSVSTYSTYTTSTDSATTDAAQQAALQQGNEPQAITPHNVHEASTFTQDNVNPAQRGHRLLATQPPTPGDAVDLTPNVRATANSTLQRISDVGQGYGGGEAAGVRAAIAQNPNRGVNLQIARDETSGTDNANGDGYGGGNYTPGQQNPDPLGSGLGSSNLSMGGTSGLTGASGSNPFGGSASSSSANSASSGSANSTSGGSGTSGASGTSGVTSSSDSEATQLQKDAETGGCKKNAKKHSVEHRLENIGFSSKQADYMYSAMHNSKNEAGLALAQVAIAAEQNPSSVSTLTSAVQTLMDTASTASATGAKGNAAVVTRDQAIETLNSAVAQAGMTVNPNAFGIGVGNAAAEPTPGSNGWEISSFDSAQ